jgi:hypothetical protein
MDGEIWGEARVGFPDWKGTAQLDERRTWPWEGLERTFGLDRKQWRVVGFNIGGGEGGYALRVYATPRAVWEKVGSDDGAEIDVTEFLVHDVDPLVVLRRMTHMFQLNMRIRGLDNCRVRVSTPAVVRDGGPRCRIVAGSGWFGLDAGAGVS